MKFFKVIFAIILITFATFTLAGERYSSFTTTMSTLEAHRFCTMLSCHTQTNFRVDFRDGSFVTLVDVGYWYSHRILEEDVCEFVDICSPGSDDDSDEGGTGR